MQNFLAFVLELHPFRRHDAGSGATVARVLLAWATLYVAIGGKALFDHEWAWCVLTPGVVVAAALLLDALPAALTAVAVAVFAGWTAYGTFTSLYPERRDRPFTPAQMADAIRVAAPGVRDVALIVGNDAQAQLWLYGDRALRSGIWDVDDFERRIDDENVDLMFLFDEQPWHARATGIVFPGIWDRQCNDLRRYLAERYPRVPLPSPLAGQFEVFDLRRPSSAVR